MGLNMSHIYVGFITGIQQELIGINTCAQDMLNALPTDKKDTLLIVHSSDYGCKFLWGICKM